MPASTTRVLLDGGDLWQGTGLANAMKGADMVEAANLLGIEAMTGHWEFTYGEEALRANLERFKGEFLAQNVFLTEEAKFNDAKAFDPASGRVFKPSLIKEIGGFRVAVIGQAFPYVPIAHPKRFTPDWTFGIRDDELQKLVNAHREKDKVDAVLLLSHNGMDVDLKLASRVTGIDVILGGHTHDAVPQPVAVKNAGGVTLVTNAGSNGKFLGVLDLDLAKGKVKDFRYRLLPVYSELLKPDPAMQALIDRLHATHAKEWSDKIATADRLLYRRDNFWGSMDQLLCNALRSELDAEIALSPGFRWGTTALAGQPLTMEDVLAETAITYPETYVQEMTGGQIKDMLEDVCDNLFNADPYYQQGGDMVRVGGLTYACTPTESIGKRISELKLDNGKALEAGKQLQGGGLGLGQSARRASRSGTCSRTICVRARVSTPYGSNVHAEGRRRQSGHCGMKRFLKTAPRGCRHRGGARAHTSVSRPRATGAAAGQAVCRTQDRVAALGQRSAEAGARDQRRQQPPEILRSGQGRDRSGGVRPGHRFAAQRKRQPQVGGEPDRARRALRRVPEYRRHHRARDRTAAGDHARRHARPGRRRADTVPDRKRIYIGQALIAVIAGRAIARAMVRIAYLTSAEIPGLALAHHPGMIPLQASFQGACHVSPSRDRPSADDRTCRTRACRRRQDRTASRSRSTRTTRRS